MPILKLQFKDNVLGEFPIEPGKSLTIGRKESNDIAIENLAVSGHHAKIDAVGDGYLLTDLKSKNGSFVNNELIASHWLKDGDVITVGKHTLVFTYAEGEDRPDDAAPGMEQTMVMDTGKYRDMLDQAMKATSSGETKLMSEIQKEQIGVLSFLSGGEGEVELTKKLTKIGKDASSDIVAKALMMAPTAVTISKRPQGYSLSYLGKGTKPKVNGETINETVMLNDFDEIEIGSVKMQFVLKG